MRVTNSSLKRSTVLILSLIVLVSNTVWGQDKPFKTTQDWIIGKNYYATFLLLTDSSLTKELTQTKAISDILSARHSRLDQAIDCTTVDCLVQAFKWSAPEMEGISSAFAKAFETNQALQALVSSKLIPSKTYGLQKELTAKDYLLKAIEQDLNAMNYVIDVYAGAKKPNYPRIDSISFDISKKSYLALLKDVRQDVLKDIRIDHDRFFETMLLVVRLLEVNERWDAAQLEPLIELENKKAFEQIAKTDFKKYPYSLLLTLGAGPGQYDQAISPGGMLRCRQAARSYFDGLAPFIVVSGGRVHPFKTPYIEAIEMKKYLITVMQVPEEAILIDPHARHTTTNLRNTSRIMINYGFPSDKFAIINSAVSHIDAVEKMADRCIKELGYVPYSLGKRISDVIIEFQPRYESLTIDPDEPLDP
ncbi:YdcF family protein [Sphingobacterium hungaricum]